VPRPAGMRILPLRRAQTGLRPEVRLSEINIAGAPSVVDLAFRSASNTDLTHGTHHHHGPIEKMIDPPPRQAGDGRDGVDRFASVARSRPASPSTAVRIPTGVKFDLLCSMKIYGKTRLY